MRIIFSEKFKKDYKRVKDKKVRTRILKQISKIALQADIGKPLGNKLKNHRSLRIKPFRIIYRVEDGSIVVVCFDHRKKVYD
ncbi:type II toxin-antitoxin system RelE/ParE family toxin [archaeon]|jgi:addiction module RelE/StbE family toxin|nr:type II toxin-antitoxin system RelE/ParE family toxin [archaeon]